MWIDSWPIAQNLLWGPLKITFSVGVGPSQPGPSKDPSGPLSASGCDAPAHEFKKEPAMHIINSFV